jgi:hypothetical protein
MTEYLRQKLKLLRMHRSKSSLLYDYRILQNFSHIMRKAT